MQSTYADIHAHLKKLLTRIEFVSNIVYFGVCNYMQVPGLLGGPSSNCYHDMEYMSRYYSCRDPTVLDFDVD
jgi:hypothetical protein